jgi:hypothetical protein
VIQAPSPTLTALLDTLAATLPSLAFPAEFLLSNQSNCNRSGVWTVIECEQANHYQQNKN